MQTHGVKGECWWYCIGVEPSCQYSFTFCYCVTDSSRGAVSQSAVWHMKQRCIISSSVCKILNPLTFVDGCWTLYGNRAMDMSTERLWVLHFNSSDSDMKDRLHSGRLSEAITPQNEEFLFCSSTWIS